MRELKKDEVMKVSGGVLRIRFGLIDFPVNDIPERPFYFYK